MKIKDSFAFYIFNRQSEHSFYVGKCFEYSILMNVLREKSHIGIQRNKWKKMSWVGKFLEKKQAFPSVYNLI